MRVNSQTIRTFFPNKKKTQITLTKNTQSVENFEDNKACRPLRIFFCDTTIKMLFLFGGLKKAIFFGGGDDFHVEIFKNTISVLGLTLRYLFKTLPKGSMFTLCSEKQKEIHTTMRNNSTGGTSILFHSFHEKDKTCVKGKEYKLVQSIN